MAISLLHLYCTVCLRYSSAMPCIAVLEPRNDNHNRFHCVRPQNLKYSNREFRATHTTMEVGPKANNPAEGAPMELLPSSRGRRRVNQLGARIRAAVRDWPIIARARRAAAPTLSELLREAWCKAYINGEVDINDCPPALEPGTLLWIAFC